MKLLVGIITIFWIYKTGGAYSQQEKNATVARYNKMRADFAQATGTRRMRKLVWNNSLSSKATSMMDDCNRWYQQWLDYGDTHRLFPESHDHQRKTGQQIINLFLDALVLSAVHDRLPQDKDINKAAFAKFNDFVETRKNLTLMLDLEVLNPSKTQIGCAKKTCTGRIPAEIMRKFTFENDTYTYTAACYLGPGNKWDAKEFGQVRRQYYEWKKDNISKQDMKSASALVSLYFEPRRNSAMKMTGNLEIVLILLLAVFFGCQLMENEC